MILVTAPAICAIVEKKRPSGSLQRFFKHRKEYHAEAQGAAYPDVFLCHPDYLRVAALGMHVHSRAEYAEQQEHHIYHSRKEYRVAYRAACHLSVTLTQAAGHERVHSHAGAYGYRDHQHLHRESERQRIERLFPSHGHVCHECAVHDVVDCLQHHRKYHRNSHAEHETPHRGCRHFVLFHVSSHKKSVAAAFYLDLRNCHTIFYFILFYGLIVPQISRRVKGDFA